MDSKSQAFLGTVRETSAKRKGALLAKTLLWRAQLAHDINSEPIFDKEGNQIDILETLISAKPDRMFPPKDRAFEGRVNPKGIPCMYFSDDKDTAMTEVRPWIGSYVTVAQFEITRDLTLLDCSIGISKPKLNFSVNEVGEVVSTPSANPEPEVWWEINEAFCKPVTRSDDVADYAPTQLLVEVFRSDGCDGVAYGSKLGKGKTAALFDLDAAVLVGRQLYRVKDIRPEFESLGGGVVLDQIQSEYHTDYAKSNFS